MPENIVNTINTLNFCFTFIFLLEAALKLTAYRSRYFREPWNVFDFLLVTSSVLVTVTRFGAISTQSLRTLRIGRMLKLLRGV